MKSPIIVALDMESERALELAKKLNPLECKVKVGSQLFTADGPIIIEKLNELGFDIFLDLKFHDIPNTVKKAVEAVIKMGVWMLNVHSLGGKEMLRAAYEAVEVLFWSSFSNSLDLIPGVTKRKSSSKCFLNIDNSLGEQTTPFNPSA